MTRTCQACFGAQRLPCERCGGSGTIASGPHHARVVCPACGGARSYTCPQCGGTGHL